MAYFFPLNYLRVRRVLQQLEQSNYLNQKYQRLIDVGTGCGTAIWAFMDHLSETSSDDSAPYFSQVFAVDSSDEANEVLLQIKKEHFQNLQLKFFDKSPQIGAKNRDIYVYCYSLNEFDHRPENLFNEADHIVIEPSTRNQGRKLMELRKKILSQAHHVWAPCPHQDQCPLLTHSKRDWCHDRLHITMPPWYSKIEQHLPVNNRTLTLSYLAYSKSRPAASTGKVRLIGDTLKERGKVRQAMCRSSEREFLSWLTRYGEPPQLERGTLLDWPDSLEKKGNEWRWAKE